MPSPNSSLSEQDSPLTTVDLLNRIRETEIDTSETAGTPSRSLASSQSSELDALRTRAFAQFADVFPSDLPDGLPPARSVDHRIELEPGSRPPARVGVRHNQRDEDGINAWVEENLKKGFIKPSQSAYAAMPFQVEKKGTTERRTVVDFRALNKQTVKSKYPLPRMEELFDRLQGAKYLSKLDLRTGFHQIRLAPEDTHKTAFRTSRGLFEYLVLAMGLCNAPGTFMQLMNETFADMINKGVLVFLDDIVIYSKTLEEHEVLLSRVLQRLREHKLYAKKSKCSLYQREVEFLGHYVGEHGLRVMEDKLQAVIDWPTPKTVREVRAFLGLTGFYRKFIRNYSSIALPLTALTRTVSGGPFSWGVTQERAFTELKRSLQSAPVLVLPDPKLPYVLHTDASGFAVGAVLQQDQGKGLQPIAFLSKKMSDAETRYPVHEQELLAIVHSLYQLRHYLIGAQLTVRTDHKSLVYFQTQPMLSGRQVRWLETLSQFDFNIEYVKGPTNVVADAFSRRADLNEAGKPIDRPLRFIDPQVQQQPVTNRSELMVCTIFTTSSDELEAELSVVSTFGSPILEAITEATKEHEAFMQSMATKHRGSHRFRSSNGVYYLDDRLVIPPGPQLRTRLMQECHDAAVSGHLGRDKTIEQLKRRFYWPLMDEEVTRYVTSCDECQRNKPSQQSPLGLLQPLPIPPFPWHTWSMDLITSLPRTRDGNDAIVVFVCKLTRLVHYAACKTAISAPELAEVFRRTVVRLHGLPHAIISDRDPRFTATFWRSFWSSLGTSLTMSTAYHPQTDGQTENSNKTLENILRSVVDFDQKDWDKHLDVAELAVNNSKQASTGYTAFYLSYGREARMPLDLAIAPLHGADSNAAASQALEAWEVALTRAKENIEAAQRSQSHYANLHRRNITFKVGDMVLVSSKNLQLVGDAHRARKLTSRFIGPYPVKRVINDNAYELELPANLRIHPVINVSQLKPYRDGTGEFPFRPQPIDRPDPEALDAFGQPIHEVERVLEHRGSGRTLQYLVLWRGYPVEEATWEPAANLTSAPDAIRAYKNLQKASGTPRAQERQVQVQRRTSARARQTQSQSRPANDIAIDSE